MAAAGFGLQAAALAFGSVLLVQALLVTSLLFALPLSAWWVGRRITRSQWLWAVLLAVSVAVIVSVGNPSKGMRAGMELWLWVIATLGPALLLCLLGARIWAGKPAAAVLLGLVAGSLWGLFAVLTKGVVDQVDDGVLAMPQDPGVVSVGAGRPRRDGGPAVVVPGRIDGGLAARGHRQRADGRLHPRHRDPRRDAAAGESGWFVLGLAVVAMVFATVALARESSDDHPAVTTDVPG